MLPGVPQGPGLRLAARYSPADGADVGGDWYDGSAAGRPVGLAIGDVMGHDISGRGRDGAAPPVLRRDASAATTPVAGPGAAGPAVQGLGVAHLATIV